MLRLILVSGAFFYWWPAKFQQVFATCGAPICLYGDAVASAFALSVDGKLTLEAPESPQQKPATPEAFQQMLGQRSGSTNPMLACHAAASRRGLPLQELPGISWLGLPEMLLKLANARPDQAATTPQVIVDLLAPVTALVLQEALDLLLAALVNDWQPRLRVHRAALSMFDQNTASDAARAYGSLALFGLSEVELLGDVGRHSGADSSDQKSAEQLDAEQLDAKQLDTRALLFATKPALELALDPLVYLRFGQPAI